MTDAGTGPRGRPRKKIASDGAVMDGEKGGNTLQTLDRGLQALTLIAENERGLTIAELASRLDVHRAIAYRLVTTLEQHGLIHRGPDSQLRLGVGVLRLSDRYTPQLRALAHPLLRDLAEEARATAFLSVSQGDECVAILVSEPRNTVLRVAYRTGSCHPLGCGAAGIAILSGRPPRVDDPADVVQARADGYSVTRGQLQKGAVGVASPVRRLGAAPVGIEASVGVVALDDLDVPTAIRAVAACAAALSAAISA